MNLGVAAITQDHIINPQLGDVISRMPLMERPSRLLPNQGIQYLALIKIGQPLAARTRFHSRRSGMNWNAEEAMFE